MEETDRKKLEGPEDELDQSVNVRFTSDEMAALEACAAEAGLDVAAFIRTRLLA